MGFACPATTKDGDKDEIGELIFVSSQLNWILDINKSKVSSDSTSRLCCSCPVTEYCACDEKINSGAEATNKSGYSATFIVIKAMECSSLFIVQTSNYLPSIPRTSIKPTAIPLLVFGGEFLFKNNKDSLLLCKRPSVFEVALSFNRNQDVWKD